MNQQDPGHICGSMCLASQKMVASLCSAYQSSRLLSKEGVGGAPLGQDNLNPGGSELKRDHGVAKRKGDRQSPGEEWDRRSSAGRD